MNEISLVERSSSDFLNSYQEKFGTKNHNQTVQAISKKLEKGECPATLRKGLEAYMNYSTNNGQPVRIRSCTAVCCTPLNFLEKISCAFLSCFCLPCTLPISKIREEKYLLKGEVSYTLENCYEAFVDAFITTTAFAANIAGTLHPPLNEQYVKNLLARYISRNERIDSHDIRLKNHIEAFDFYWKKLDKNWKTGDEIPDKKATMNSYLENLRNKNNINGNEVKNEKEDS